MLFIDEHEATAMLFNDRNMKQQPRCLQTEHGANSHTG